MNPVGFFLLFTSFSSLLFIHQTTNISSTNDMFVLNTVYSLSGMIASSVRGPYLVLSIVSSLRWHWRTIVSQVVPCDEAAIEVDWQVLRRMWEELDCHRQGRSYLKACTVSSYYVNSFVLLQLYVFSKYFIQFLKHVSANVFSCLFVGDIWDTGTGQVNCNTLIFCKCATYCMWRVVL